MHGYHNGSEKPLHILVFATPENNLSVYIQSKLSRQNYTGIRLVEKVSEKIASNRIVFSSVPPNDFSNTLIIDLENQIIENTQFNMESNSFWLMSLRCRDTTRGWACVDRIYTVAPELIVDYAGFSTTTADAIDAVAVTFDEIPEGLGRLERHEVTSRLVANLDK